MNKNIRSAELGLMVLSVVFNFSAIIYVITSPESDKWLSRACLGIVCYGFFNVIRLLNNINDKIK